MTFWPASSTRATLEDRLEGFGLTLAADKTQGLEFGRFARANAYTRGEKPKEFTFLGFTSRKKLGQSLQRFTDWARRARSVLRKGEMFRLARARVVGHLRYYAITDNAKRCRVYLRRAERILFTWLNRKSQRPAYTWSAFVHALQYVGWPTSRIRIDLNPCRRAEAR